MGESLWQLEIDDTSPSISYSPFPDTFSTPNLGAGWNPYYDLSGFAPAQGVVGNGASSHITSTNGASFTLEWRGTGVQIFGNTTQASFSVTLNSAALQLAGVSSSPTSTAGNGLLADIDNLSDGLHTLTFTAIIPEDQVPLNSSMVVLDRLVLRTSPPLPSETTYSSQIINGDRIAFSGQWKAETSSSTSYAVSRASGDRASMRFNGTSFTLLGATSPEGADFMVLVDGVQTTLSSRSSFNVRNTTLFFVTGLNTSVEHRVEVTNDSGGQLALLSDGFSAIVSSSPVNTVILVSRLSSSPSPATATSKNSSFAPGAIAALSLAGILAFILLTSGILYCIYRRRRRKTGRAGSFYTFSRPSSGKGSLPRGQRWLNNLIRAPKQQEAGVTGYGDVLDIRPVVSSESKEDLADIDEVTRESIVVDEKDPQANKGKIGFGMWRRESSQGKMAGLGLPVLFRQSRTEAKARSDEKASSPQTENESGSRYSHVRGGSDESMDSSERRYIALANLRKKGKARQITGAGSNNGEDKSPSGPPSARSWSPSFRLALPIPSPSQASGSKFKWKIPGLSKHPQPSPTSSHSRTPPPTPGGQPGQESNGSGQDKVSSFAAASDPSPITTRKRIADTLQPIRPPSYATAQGRDSPSSNGLSIPRSVSHSGSDSPVHITYPRSPLHQREDSRNLLLREGGSPEDDSGVDLPDSQNAARFIGRPIYTVPRSPEPGQPPPLAVEIPTSTHLQDGESPSTSDNPSVLAPPSVGQALRGLSPRTSERGGGSGSGTSPSLGLGFLYPSARQSSHTQASGLTSDGETSPVEFARNVSPSGVPLALQSSSPSPAEESRDDHRISEPVQLDLRAVSPFQVDFDWRSVRTRTNISHSSGDDSHGHYQTAPSRYSRQSQSSAEAIPPLPSSPAFMQGSSRAPFRLTMSTLAHPPHGGPPSVMSTEGITSFLDFTSSREGSVRTKSLRTVASNERIFGDPNAPPLPGLPPHEPRSRWSSTTAPSFNTRRFTGVTNKDSSGESEAGYALSNSEGEYSSGSNTFPIPVNMTIPPSPHHIMDFPQGVQQSGPSQRLVAPGIRALPTAPVLDLESPTDSVPRTVSDIHFRQTDFEDSPTFSRRTSDATGFHSRLVRASREPALAEIPDEELFARPPPLPSIHMIPPSPQTAFDSPSVTRPRPLPIPPVARTDTPSDADSRTQP